MLEEMGHPQPPTQIQTDNSASYGILNNKANQKLSKAMYMRFYWVKTGLHKDYAKSTGNQEAKNWQITSPSITPQRITEACVTNMYTENMLP
jgi:hypothetical protein